MNNIGKRCQKKRKRGNNPKPFKSGLRVNTIKDITINPNSGKEAYTFEEDNSCVDCDIIVIL